MLPSRMKRIDGQWLRNQSSNPILQMKCQRQLHFINIGKACQLVVSLTLILAQLTQHVNALDYEQNRIPSTDDFSYDYEDGFDPVLTFRKSQDQSMLGKGEKIGEEQISFSNSVSQRSEIELSGKVNPDTSDASGHNASVMNIADRQQQNINSISSGHLPGIDLKDATDAHQHKVVSKDQKASQEFGNVNHNFKHTFTSVLGTTLKKNKDKLVTRLTALSGTNNTVESGAPLSNKTQANASSNGQSSANRLDYRKETSLEYGNTSREMNFGSYNNNKVTKDGSRISNGAMAFGNSNALGNMSKSLAQAKPIIYIAGLFPLTEDIPAGAVGRGVLPAVQIALDHVNTDVHRNRKYILNMASNDTRISRVLST